MITKSGATPSAGRSARRCATRSGRHSRPTRRRNSTRIRGGRGHPDLRVDFGGPILRDRLWFFTAGRFENSTSSASRATRTWCTEAGDDDKRYEAKGTWSMTRSHTLKAATRSARGLHEQQLRRHHGSRQPLRQLAARGSRRVNYTGVIKQNFFLEAQYSRRHLSFVGSGSRFTDIPRARSSSTAPAAARAGTRRPSARWCGNLPEESSTRRSATTRT